MAPNKIIIDTDPVSCCDMGNVWGEKGGGLFPGFNAG